MQFSRTPIALALLLFPTLPLYAATGEESPSRIETTFHEALETIGSPQAYQPHALYSTDLSMVVQAKPVRATGFSAMEILAEGDLVHPWSKGQVVLLQLGF